MYCAIAALAIAAAPAPDEGSGIHPAEVQKLVYADAQKLNKEDAPYMRYFRVTTGKSHRNDFLVVFCAHLNKLSTRKNFAWPTFIHPEILRIDVRDYGWDERGKKETNVLVAYEKTAKRDPVWHQPAEIIAATAIIPIAWPGGFDAAHGKEYERGVYKTKFNKGAKVTLPHVLLDQAENEKLRRLLYTESPILDAEWFFVQTARQQSIYGENEPGFGYYDALALKDRDAFFALAGADPKKAKEINRTWKGAVAESSVARHNRLVFRQGAIGEFIWGTFDTQDPRNRGDLLRNLRDGEFKHQAEEWFAVLPNGLDFNFLSNDKGVRQATAPDNIISADTSKIATDSNKRYKHNDTPVHANLSCLGCHGPTDLLMDVNDRIRQSFGKQPLLLVDPDKKVTRELQDEYLTDIDKHLKRDRSIYVDAIKEVTTSKLNPDGWTPGEFALKYREAFDRYAHAPITHDQAARELGVPKEKMIASLKTYSSQYGRGQGEIALTAWAHDGKGMKRQQWEQRYALAAVLSAGIRPPEVIEGVKRK